MTLMVWAPLKVSALVPRATVPPMVKSPVEAFQVWAPVKLSALLIICRFVLLLTMPPVPRLIVVPPTVKAEAPLLKVMVRMAQAVAPSVLGDRRTLPANWRSWLVPLAVGAVPAFQLVDVLQLLLPGPVLPPLHRKVAACRFMATSSRAEPAASRLARRASEAGRRRGHRG